MIAFQGQAKINLIDPQSLVERACCQLWQGCDIYLVGFKQTPCWVWLGVAVHVSPWLIPLCKAAASYVGPFQWGHSSNMGEGVEQTLTLSSKPLSCCPAFSKVASWTEKHFSLQTSLHFSNALHLGGRKGSIELGRTLVFCTQVIYFMKILLC